MKTSLKTLVSILFLSYFIIGCQPKKEFVLSFGSCNNQHVKNELWAPILQHHPDLFIWGGDIIYSDTEDMSFMEKNYAKMKFDSSYVAFKNRVSVLGTWDDHDYGINDGGENYQQKDSVQQLFLDFFDVPENSPRRSQKGIYFSKDYEVNKSFIKVIVLDTRFFRSDLTKDSTGVKRYVPNHSGDVSMLGTAQWNWLEEELTNSNAQFNVIMSSIQFLSYEHGFESWGTMPQEVDKMKQLIIDSKAKGVIILSGDRHIAEISRTDIPGLRYPLIDFTSSGMTHSYESFDGEKNPYRVVDVVSKKNFGILRFDFDNNKVIMEIRGEGNTLYRSFEQLF